VPLSYISHGLTGGINLFTLYVAAATKHLKVFSGRPAISIRIPIAGLETLERYCRQILETRDTAGNRDTTDTTDTRD
jgi:hypothetical protein